jgi:rhodanese-related sulfurtransferase
MPMSEVPTVSVDEIPADAVILDVREDFEWVAGHIETAVHVPMNDVPARVGYEPGPLTQEATIVVICKMGGRSAQVTGWLNRQGYRALNVDGGMLAWATAHRPMISSDGSTPTVA